MSALSMYLMFARSFSKNNEVSPSKTSQEEKLDGLVQRCWKSPLFGSLAATTGLVGFTVVVVTTAILTGAILVPSVILGTVLGVGVGALGVLIYTKKWKLIYEVSLNYTLIKNYFNKDDWDNTIIEDKLVLGAIPLRTQGHDKKLKDQNVKAVLSLVKKFEATNSSILTVPVSKETWEKENIQYKRIGIFDCKAPTDLQIDQAVEFIHNQIQEGNKVYVHCKAGRGRSALVVLGYIIKYHPGLLEGVEGKDKVEKALNYVRKKRPQVGLFPWQLNALRSYAERIPNN